MSLGWRWLGKNLFWCVYCSVWATGGAAEDVALITDALGEGRSQIAGRPSSGRVSGLRVGLQRGVSADGQRKRPHPPKGREEGILRQSRYSKAEIHQDPQCVC